MRDAPTIRHFNSRFFLCSVLVVGFVAVLVYWLHSRQVTRNVHAFLDQATIAEGNKQLPLAANWLQQYLQRVPGDLDTRERYARLLVKEGTPRSLSRALNIMGTVLDRDPNRTDLQWERVRLLIRTKQYRLAREQLTRLGERQKNDGEIDWLLAQCDLSEKQYEPAEKHLESALNKHYGGPPNSTAVQAEHELLAPTEDHDPPVACRTQLAWVLRQQGKTKQADERIQELVKQNTCAAYLAAYECWTNAQESSKANAALQAAVKLRPDDERVLLTVAKKEGRDGHLDQARKGLERAIRLHPKEPAFYRLLAALDIQAGDLKEAAKHLWQLLDQNLAPKVADITTLAEVLVDLRQIDNDHGAEALLAALVNNPDFPPDVLYYLQARVLGAQGQWEKACKTLQDNPPQTTLDKALQFKRTLLLGQCLQHQGNTDQAITAYRQALEISPTAPQAQRTLARALADAGQVDDALETLRTLQSPDQADMLFLVQLLIRHNLGQPEGKRNWDEIDKLLQQIKLKQPNDTEVVLLAANALLARDSRNAAQVRASLEAASGKHPSDWNLWLARIQLEERQKRFDQADKLFAQARHETGDTVAWRLARAAFILEHEKPAKVAQALVGLEQGLEHFSDDDQVRLLEGLAAEHAAAGNRAETQRLLGKLMKRRPKDDSLHVRLFDLAMRAGLEHDAGQIADKLQQLERDNGNSWRLAQAILLLQRARQGDQKALAEARQQEQELIVRRPGWSRVVLLQAEIAELEHHPDQAIERYQEAVRLGERTPHVVQRLVSLLYERGQHQTADDLLRKLPETLLASANLGRIPAEVALQSNHPDEAIRWARLGVSPNSKDYRDQLWLGRLDYAAGLLKDAEGCFRQAVRLATRKAEPHIALVVFLSETHQKEKAQKAIDQAGQDLPTADAPLVLAQCYEVVGDSAAALRYYQQALKARPTDAQVLHLLASFYINHAGVDEAEGLLHRLIDPRTHAPEADAAWARRWLALSLARQPAQRSLNQALALLDQNVSHAGQQAIEDVRARAAVLATRPWRREEAITLFEQCVEKRALPLREQLVLASLYLADQKWDDADRCLERILARDQTNVQAWVLYTRSMLQQGRPNAAADRLAHLEQVAPDAFGTMELQARILREQQQAAAVSALLLGRAAKHPNERPALAALLEELEQFQAAEQLYRADLAQSGQPEKMLALAGCLGRQNHVRPALDLCERARRAGDPLAVASTSLQILSQAACTAGDFSRVATWLTESRAAHPELVPLTTALADVRALQADYEQAERLFREVVQQRPDDTDALNNLAWLLAVKRQQPREALLLIQRAIELVGPKVELLDTCATVWVALNQPDKALKALGDALAQKSTMELQYHLALAEWAANHPDKARQAFEQANKLGLSPLKLSPFERGGYLKFKSHFDKPKSQ